MSPTDTRQPMSAREALEDFDREVAAILQEAWQEYTALYGARPHGTFAQLHSMLALKSAGKRIRALAASLEQPEPSPSPTEAQDDGWHCRFCRVPLATRWGWCDKCERGAKPVSEKPAIPEGWVLVPREPTEEMMACGAVVRNNISMHCAAAIYGAMLAAAPKEGVDHG